MRVITGTARGRKLKEPVGMDIRPTTDGVKEAVFSMLQFDIEGRQLQRRIQTDKFFFNVYRFHFRSFK